MKHNQQGYILLMTFSMLTLCIALVSMFLAKGMTHKKFTTIVLEREKMNQFILSTPALAQSFLSFPAEDNEQSTKKAENATKNTSVPGVQQADYAQKLLEKVLPVVNKAQRFTMKEIVKDFPVVINLTFFCESGKININGLYDLVNKKFYNEGVAGKDQKVFATWLFDKIAKITERTSLLQPFIEYLKQREAPFNDVTELLAIKEFAACFGDSVFYEAPIAHARSDKNSKKLFLTDIFTVVSESDTIQPWLLSPSVCVLLDIPQQISKQNESGNKEEKKIDISSFKSQADWKKDWDLGPKALYNVSFDAIPEQARNALATQFSATTFSILVSVEKEASDDSSSVYSAGSTNQNMVNTAADTENNNTVRIFAILKQNKLSDGSTTYDVIKIYQV
jgi:hypothetical protein